MKNHEQTSFGNSTTFPNDEEFIPIHQLHPGGRINLLKACDWWNYR